MKLLSLVGVQGLVLGALALFGCGGDNPPEESDGVVNGQGTWTDQLPEGANVCPIFPADNWWNTDISNAPVDPMSSAYIASLGANKELYRGFGNNQEGFPFGYVDDSVPKVPVKFGVPYNSDPGPYPIPKDPPIQPHAHDRHLLLIQTDECKLYELFFVSATPEGWYATSGVIWDLLQNEQRPPGSGSADAAGLAIFPGLIRYDETEKGEIKHAIRFAAYSAQNAYVFPATNPGQGINNPNMLPMGGRLRLKASVDISGFTPRVQTILTALKHYGLILADRAPDDTRLYIHGAPDERWDTHELSSMREVHLSDFEVIETGPITKAY